MKPLQCVLFLFVISNINGAKILGIFNYPSKSHYILTEKLLKALASKGHEVTMLSPFKSKELAGNYSEIVITELLKKKDEILSSEMLEKRNASLISQSLSIINNLIILEELFLNHTKVQNMMNSKDQYDVALVIWFGNDVNLALAQQLAKHTIIFSTVGSHHEITDLTKAPAPLSYVPSLYPPFPAEMTFIQRTHHLLAYLLVKLINSYCSYREEILLNKYFPNRPSTQELHEHVSLVLLNTHYSIETPRPYVPQMIQIGGLHIDKPKQLTGELKQFMDDAKEGVILFSLGSNIRSSDLDKERLESITKCFSKLPYKVLWKFEKDNVLNLSKNINISKWLPQSDLLAHKNTKLFITHGGLLSTTEAVYHGVPMIGIPIFGDQDGNVKQGAIQGYIRPLEISDLTEESLCTAITEVMTSPKYRDNIQKRSQIYKDQPMKPLDKAVYWVEYVLRHNGAHHLKTSAFKLNCFQLHLIDVLVFIFLVFCLSMYVLCKVLKCLLKCFYTKPIEKKVKKEKKKSKIA